MILNKFIRIKVKGCRKLKYFISLGYEPLVDFIEINIKDLNKGSREIVEVECDYCKKIVNITYKEYLRNISIGDKFACSMKCGSMKSKETNIINFGVEHPMKLKETQEKVKKTNLDRYGVEYLQQSNDIRVKTKEVLLKKWGVDHISKSNYSKEKSKKTCIENNGFEYPMMSDIVKQKSKETCLEKYGVDNPSKSEIIKEKKKETCLKNWGVEKYILCDDFKNKSNKSLLKNWGVDNPSKSNIVKNKIKETCLEKYGAENPLQNNDIKYKSKKTLLKNWGVDNISKNELYRITKFNISKDVKYIRYEKDGYSLFKCTEGHEFLIHSDNYFHRKKANLPLCTICNPIGDSQSIKEKELYKFISSIYNGEIIQSYRDGLEIDVYLPELKIGFEFNGLYWHSEEWKDKNYHLNKTNYFKNKGIKIIHIWEDDWVNKQDILKSQISNWIGITNNRIYARKCEIVEISSKDSNKFLNENHIQGSDKSNIKLGLYYNNEIVSVMTFNKLEGRNKMGELEWNLSRFCNKKNTNVIGGASKLFSYFKKTYNPNRIISYADKDWSIGEIYYKLGFKLINETKPDYKYIINGKRKHKSNFKKNNLKIKGDKITETEFMNKFNIYKIWDCGKIKFQI